MDNHFLLIISPQDHWGIVAVTLKRAVVTGMRLEVKSTVWSKMLGDSHPDLLPLVMACEATQPPNLFARHANKKVWRQETAFWKEAEEPVRNHIKHLADTALVKAVKEAQRLGIGIVYSQHEVGSVKPADCLEVDELTVVTPVMNFTRHDQGITYTLHLRIGGELHDNPCQEGLNVLTWQPCAFTLGRKILFLGKAFSGKLLAPFTKKGAVDIPKRVENDYFRRFIFKQMATAEINAEGFLIEDINLPPQPVLTIETAINSTWMLLLRFRYGDVDYQPGGHGHGRVRLCDDDGAIRFYRQRRDHEREEQFLLLLATTGRQLQSSGYLPFDTASELTAWLQQHALWLRQQGFSVVQPAENPFYIDPLRVEQSEQWHGDWLQTSVTIVLDDGRLRIPFNNLRDTILRGEQEYLLPSGQRLVIPQEWLQRYGELLLTSRPRGNALVRHRSQVVRAWTVTAGGPASANPAEAIGLPQKLNATLRPYQATGYQWLWRNFEGLTGCCLADEMGLGKTLQTIALLLKYKETARAASSRAAAGLLFSEVEMQGSDTTGIGTMEYLTSLVVAPASVVHNWRNELRRFAPNLLVCTYTGDTGKREEKRRALMRWDVVITTYRTLANDIAHLSARRFGIIVFDESQAFKTAASQIHQAVARLQALHRVALSGTPVENNLGELWSLMNVLNPDLLGDARSFNRSFVQPLSQPVMQHKQADVLKQLIAPYFLKRTKEEVLNDLPERQDEVVVCPMTDEQTSLYAKELSKARNEWMDGRTPESQRRMGLMAAIQRLRHIANGEGKMNVVMAQLENLRATGHKTLIFSEYVGMLDQVAKELDLRRWPYALLTGKTTNREQVIAHFQNTPHCQFFLISLKAGGVGLNLTAADYVFLLDPWWNLSAEEQAIARSHRIGQHRPVFVYRFVSENTLEEQILQLQDRKQALIDSVMPFIGLGREQASGAVEKPGED